MHRADVATLGWRNTTVTYAQSFVRALLNSEESSHLLVCEEISSVHRFASFGPMMRASEEGRAILRERPRITRDRLDQERLRALPEGTLGRAYAEHLAENGLDPDVLAVPVTRGPTEEACYLLERARQTHDIWHVAVGLGARPHEEVLLQAFQWAQLRMIHSALIVGLGSLKHLSLPKHWPLLPALRDSYQAGQKAHALLPVFWERRWEQPLAGLRVELGLRPASSWRGYRAAS